MKKTILIIQGILPVLIGFMLAAPPLPAVDFRETLHRSREDRVREPEIPISEDVVIPGFWRPRARNGYQWISAVKDEHERWHSGYWSPLNQDTMKAQTRLPGYWGPANREGYIRINIHDRAGEYPSGSWESMNTYQVTEQPRQWVPGYWTGQRWVPGYWRIREREGHTWIEGYYGADGRWEEAHWEPSLEAAAGSGG
ncbi:MAG: hypothetical protein V1789_09300 [PVC group bacterium]